MSFFTAILQNTPGGSTKFVGRNLDPGNDRERAYCVER